MMIVEAKTWRFIIKLLEDEVQSRKALMMDCINRDVPALELRIEQYREAFIAMEELSEWLDENDEGQRPPERRNP